MARTRIAEFGIIQKTLALATVAIYVADGNGENTGVLADIYQAATGDGKRNNPQILDKDGKLEADCWVEDTVMAAISNINETTERSIRKIKANPLQYPLPLTSASVLGANVASDSAAAVAAAQTATTKAAQTEQDAINTTNNATVSQNASNIAVQARNEANSAADRAENAAALLPKNNYTATTDPTAGDDSVDGYSPGSNWLNTSTGDRFICGSAAVGAAVWNDVTGIAPEDLGTMAFEAKTAYFAKSEVATIRLIPQNLQNAAYTLAVTDVGKYVRHPSTDAAARIFTIPHNDDVAYPIDGATTFVNQNGGGVITIHPDDDVVVRFAGIGTTGDRTLAANGMATILKLDTNEWIITGVGLT